MEYHRLEIFPPRPFIVDGVELEPGDHVLLLKQNTPCLNGPWIYHGDVRGIRGARPMSRPSDFDAGSEPTSAYVVTSGPDGKNYAHSRWRATWTDDEASLRDGSSGVDRYDPKFHREDTVVNAALFESLNRAFESLVLPAPY
ncbi:MAG: hypothetical protein KJ698_13655, partial [Actinobacteria bacterium]|nr:hypothetical protein [Actinomycetota bacterium]